MARGTAWWLCVFQEWLDLDATVKDIQASLEQIDKKKEGDGGGEVGKEEARGSDSESDSEEDEEEEGERDSASVLSYIACPFFSLQRSRR